MTIPLPLLTVSLILLTTLPATTSSDACCAAAASAAGTATIPHPFASQPVDWDVDDDGPWAPPDILLSELPTWYRMRYECLLGFEAAAPWLVLGVIAAAFVAACLSIEGRPSLRVRSWLGGGSERGRLLSALSGAILGLFVPLCSCGALPMAVALSSEGVSVAGIAAFVTAAQAAGIDSVMFTVGRFGWRIAVYRLALAGLLATLVGVVVPSRNEGTAGKKSHSPSCCDEPNCIVNEKGGWRILLSRFGTEILGLFGSVAPWVGVSVLFTAGCNTWLPTGTVLTHHSGTLSTRILLFLVTFPLQICEHGVVSLTETLLKTFHISSGTAFALMVVGPAVNAGTLLLLSRLAGGDKWMIVRAGSVVFVAWLAISYMIDFSGVLSLEGGIREAGASSPQLPQVFTEWAGSMVMMLLVVTLGRSFFTKGVGVSLQTHSKEKKNV